MPLPAWDDPHMDRARGAQLPQAGSGGEEGAGSRLPLVELEGVARRYDMGEATVTALEGIDLRIDPGEFAVVLGPSGSGKTTLLNMIGALDSPTEGAVRIAGEDIAGASRSELFAFRRHTVSFIFQTFNLFPALSALENVEFGADVSGHGEARECRPDAGAGRPRRPRRPLSPRALRR